MQKLATYNKPTIPGQSKPPLEPVICNGAEEYEVEKILQHRTRGRTIEYLVRWKGYTRADDTSEKEQNLKHASEKLSDYKKLGLQAVRVAELDKVPDGLLTRDSTLQVELIGGKSPTRGSDDAAGLDLYANQTLSIQPQQRELVPTGIKIKLPAGTYGRIAPRSGLSLKGIDVAAGVVDRDFRGEVKVVLVNNGSTSFTIAQGDRIAQLVLECIATADIEIVETVGETSRGTQDFGSTGV